MQQDLDCFHIGVKGLVVADNGQMLLLKRQHPFKGLYWDIPGGRLQRRETLNEALFREVKEEIGLESMPRIEQFSMALTDIRVSVQNGDAGLIFSVFLIRVAKTFTPQLSSEHIHFEWCSLLEGSEKLKTRYPQEFLEKMKSLQTQVVP